MFTLRIGSTWESEIATIRDAITDDTNLIRFDNACYRMCRSDAGSFAVKLAPVAAPSEFAIRLSVQTRDLYVSEIAGHRFDRYASTLDLLTPQALGLNSALLELPNATGKRLFELQSLIVLCVAESLRSDHVATAVGQTIRATTTGLLGAPTRLPTFELLRTARAWGGQTSDAIFRTSRPRPRRSELVGKF